MFDYLIFFKWFNLYVKYIFGFFYLQITSYFEFMKQLIIILPFYD